MVRYDSISIGIKVPQVQAFYATIVPQSLQEHHRFPSCLRTMPYKTPANHIHAQYPIHETRYAVPALDFMLLATTCISLPTPRRPSEGLIR